MISRVWNKYQQTRNVDDRPRSGHPRATTRVRDRFVRNQVLRNRSQTANQIVAHLHEATGVRVPGETIRNRLDVRRAHVVCTLTNRHIAHTREWCRERQNWGIRRWPRVICLDESLFTLDFLDRRGGVWRRRNERHANVTMQFHDRFGYGVGWYHYDCTREGHWAVLPGQHPFVVPFASSIDRRFVRQENTARAHLTVHESSMLTSSSTTSIECHGQQ